MHTYSKKGLLVRQTSSLNLLTAGALVLGEEMEQRWVAGSGKEVSRRRDSGSLCFGQLSCLGLCFWHVGLLQNVPVLNREQMDSGRKDPSTLG